MGLIRRFQIKIQKDRPLMPALNSEQIYLTSNSLYSLMKLMNKFDSVRDRAFSYFRGRSSNNLMLQTSENRYFWRIVLAITL